MPAPQGLFGNHAKEISYKTENKQELISSKVEIQRKGDWIFPVEILIQFDNGTSQLVHWSGIEGLKIFEFTGTARIISAQIDPLQKILLDVNLNNNSMTLEPQTAALWKYTAKVMFWMQNLLTTLSFLF